MNEWVRAFQSPIIIAGRKPTKKPKASLLWVFNSSGTFRLKNLVVTLV